MEIKVEKYLLQQWEEEETGLWLDENDEWILMASVPLAYATDGYKLIRKKYLQHRQREAAEKQVERVLRLRHTVPALPEGFRFDSTLQMMQWIEKRYGLFEFQDEDEEEIYIGKIHHVEDDDTFFINYIDSEGQEETCYHDYFRLSEIRTFTFDSDYFQAIRLLWEDNHR